MKKYIAFFCDSVKFTSSHETSGRTQTNNTMTASQFAAKSTYYAMVTDMASKTVKFINAMGYSCAMAECTMAECNGYKAKAIKKADKSKWENAAKSVGFSIVF